MILCPAVSKHWCILQCIAHANWSSYTWGVFNPKLQHWELFLSVYLSIFVCFQSSLCRVGLQLSELFQGQKDKVMVQWTFAAWWSALPAEVLWEEQTLECHSLSGEELLWGIWGLLCWPGWERIHLPSASVPAAKGGAGLGRWSRGLSWHGGTWDLSLLLGLQQDQGLEPFPDLGSSWRRIF